MLAPSALHSNSSTRSQCVICYVIYYGIPSGLGKVHEMSVTTARPGLRGYQDSVRLTLPEVVSDLRDALGAKLVAYLGGVGETRAVRDWADGQRTPSDAAAQRLRTAFQIVALLREREGASTVASWFQGLNPELGDRSPARVLREDAAEMAGAEVLAAARSFVALG